MKRLNKILILLLAVVVVASASGLLYLRHCKWCPQTAAEYATEHAEKKSVGLCALYVRKAINAGGIPLYRGGNAWHYKYLLQLLNFEEKRDSEELKVGDIVVFQPIGGRKYGHIAIWNGRQWVSDFRQHSIIVHSDYTTEGAEYCIYRRQP
jgi:hypothetical protein